jgi:hypothetical protein
MMESRAAQGKVIQSRRWDARSIATRGKFTRKVELLETWVKAGALPDGIKLPDGPIELRKWTDPSLGLEAWSSPNVASPNGRYSDLRSRFDIAIKKLRELGIGGSGLSVRERYRLERAHNKVLAAQILTMRWQYRKQEGKLARAQDLLRKATKQVAELTAELNKLLPFKVK